MKKENIQLKSGRILKNSRWRKKILDQTETFKDIIKSSKKVNKKRESKRECYLKISKMMIGPESELRETIGTSDTKGKSQLANLNAKIAGTLEIKIQIISLMIKSLSYL